MAVGPPVMGDRGIGQGRDRGKRWAKDFEGLDRNGQKRATKDALAEDFDEGYDHFEQVRRNVGKQYSES